jgi:hypothetical protein
MGIEPSPNNKTQSASLLQTVELVEVNRRMATGDTFVVNVVTAWCPDCAENEISWNRCTSS